MKWIYLEGGENDTLAVLRGRFPVDSRANATDTGDVHLQLTGDTFLEVNDPQRLVGTNLDSSDLFKMIHILDVNVIMDV